MKIGLSNYQDFLALLVRRKWWIVWPFFALSATVGLLVYYLPPTYVSEAFVQVLPRDVPQNYVVDLTGGASQRLVQIRQRILSRGVLGEIISEFGDRLREPPGLSADARIARLNSQIDISVQGQQGGAISLRIAYQNADPEVAKEIADRLTDEFVAQDSEFRQEQVSGTTDFLSAELEVVSGELDESNREMAALRNQYQFELPEQLESNWRLLESLNSQRQSNADQVDRRREIVMDLERELSETEETLPVDQIAAVPPPPDPIVVRYENAVAAHEQLLLEGKTSEHPEVLNAAALVARLEEQLPPDFDVSQLGDTGTVEAAEAPNPVYQNLTDQLEAVEAELDDLDEQRARIEADLQRVNERIANTPATGEVIAEAVRRNADLQARYSDLRGKLREAELSQRLETAERGTQFDVVDPANVPLTPSKPDKLATVLEGMFGSLVLAIALAVGVDVLRQKVWTQSEVEALWGVPVLVEIPEILTDSDVGRIRRKKVGRVLAAFGGAVVYSGCLYLVHLNHDVILQRLDPVIQRLVY